MKPYNRTVFTSDILKESYERYTHPCGLDIYIFPKKMTATYAILGTRYGSIHNAFRIGDQDTVVTVPDGIAHFLEHKLFINEDGTDSFERFSEYGADANAYTSFNKTAYLFSCTDRFAESLGELIDFVTHPHFTEESVESEIGIISEEIRMYDDSPSDRCFYGMLEAMYEHHSIRRNICGSCASIREITPSLLYRCHEAFYQFSNMALIVCGDVDADTVLSIADRHLPQTAKKIDVTCVNENLCESRAVFRAETIQHMQVAKPLFQIGFKDVDIPADGDARQRKDAAMAILDEMLFSRAGELYSSLFERELISPSFSYGYTISETCAYNAIGGEADDPYAVLSELRSHLAHVKEVGLNRDDFDRAQRVMYAEFVKSFDSTDNIANNLLTFVCENSELLQYAEIIDSITFEEVEALFDTAFCEEATALSIIFPISNTSST